MSYSYIIYKTYPICINLTFAETKIILSLKLAEDSIMQIKTVDLYICIANAKRQRVNAITMKKTPIIAFVIKRVFMNEAKNFLKIQNHYDHTRIEYIPALPLH